MRTGGGHQQLAERILNNGYSPEPSAHLNTLTGQLNSCPEGSKIRPKLEAAISFLEQTYKLQRPKIVSKKERDKIRRDMHRIIRRDKGSFDSSYRTKRFEEPESTGVRPAIIRLRLDRYRSEHSRVTRAFWEQFSKEELLDYLNSIPGTNVTRFRLENRALAGVLKNKYSIDLTSHFASRRAREREVGFKRNLYDGW
ncbi:MAG: hypothetical protein JSW08_03370 [archaeon]|nr:MAG: hypothetical protein JSW08_03370 [archaeon]